MVGVVGDADALGPGVFGVGLGAANALQRKSETNFDLTRSRTMRKERKPFKLCWLKESY